MAFRRNTRSRRSTYRSAGPSRYRSRGAVGRRSPSRARRGSGGVRQQTVKIVLQTAPASPVASAFGQQVEARSERAKF